LSSPAVARRYAAALADVVIARGEAREVQEELLAWESMINSSDLFLELLNNPTIPYDQKQKALKELISRTKVRETTANFLQVLLRNQRLGNLPEINKRLALVLDERSGLVGAEVVSARPVPEATRSLILEQLRQLTGKKVRVTFATDENLIGGIVTRIGSTLYDGSIRNQLQELERKLAGN
jgi:F-type H+-transporting ATPase subunit delta